MTRWLRTMAVATFVATAPATVTFLAQDACDGCGTEEEDAEHEGNCGGGGGSHSSGGGHQGPGINLSVPVIFAEGYGLKGLPSSLDHWLRPRPSDVYPDLPEYFNPNEVVVSNGVTYYPQRTTSHWQAGWRDGVPGTPEPATVNWADNLTHRSLTPASMHRIETVLYQDAADTMTAYSLEPLAGRGSKKLHGTTGQTYPSSYRTVFSVSGRFTIEKLIARAGPLDTRVPGMTRAVYDSFTDIRPRGGCNAQVNESGSVVYSYQWPLRQWPIAEALKLGWWRITFSLDPVARYTVTPQKGGTPQEFVVPRNAYFEALDASDIGGTVLFSPTLPDATTSVLEIELVDGAGGGSRPNPNQSHTLTITPPDDGTITTTGVVCGVAGTSCSATHLTGTYLQLTGVPAPGYQMVSWTGDADCQDGVVILDADTSCSARFAIAGGAPPAAGLHRLVVVPPTGGTIFGPAIACGDAGAVCVVDLPAGAVIGLEAVPSPGGAFAGWSAACPGGVVSMTADRVCVPTFTGSTQPPQPPASGLVRLTIVRPAGGTIYAAGIVCGDAGAVCAVDMPVGVTLGLDAVPAVDFAFDGWIGQGCGPQVTLNASLTCTPSFSKK